MYFEDPEKCPLLEDQESKWDEIPYCAMLYSKLTAWTLSELCYKNFAECPTYKKCLKNQTKNALQNNLQGVIFLPLFHNFLLFCLCSCFCSSGSSCCCSRCSCYLLSCGCCDSSCFRFSSCCSRACSI